MKTPKSYVLRGVLLSLLILILVVSISYAPKYIEEWKKQNYTPDYYDWNFNSGLSLSTIVENRSLEVLNFGSFVEQVNDFEFMCEDPNNPYTGQDGYFGNKIECKYDGTDIFSGLKMNVTPIDAYSRGIFDIHAQKNTNNNKWKIELGRIDYYQNVELTIDVETMRETEKNISKGLSRDLQAIGAVEIIDFHEMFSKMQGILAPGMIHTSLTFFYADYTSLHFMIFDDYMYLDISYWRNHNQDENGNWSFEPNYDKPSEYYWGTTGVSLGNYTNAVKEFINQIFG